MTGPRRILALLILVALSAAVIRWNQRATRASGSFQQQAYIWNRAWTPALRDSIHASANFSAYVVLAAEGSFHGGRLDMARMAVDYSALAKASIPIGLALRIGPCSGESAGDEKIGKRLGDVAAALIADARAAGVFPVELQIDFDCAESKLDRYRIWIEAIKRRAAPVAVTITALPAWLSQPAFPPLARSAGAYVLQVHSLQRPASVDSAMTLCDVPAARQWVEQAGRIGVPFRVALPTYGYLIAFDENGIFKGLSAEGPAVDWPAGAQIRPLRADPAAMAGLISAWNADRPRCMMGVIWYRLPTADDALNWRWTTLQSVMAGHVPLASVHAAVTRSEPGLYEVQLLNDGQADAPLTSPVKVRWQGTSLIAGDGLGGFEQTADGNMMTFRPLPAVAIQRLAPGDRRAIGWLRFSEDKEVQAHVEDLIP